MLDCKAFTEDGWHYQFGKKWAYAMRGSSKKFKVDIEENRRLLEKMCERNRFNDLSRTLVLVGFIKEKGEEV